TPSPTAPAAHTAATLIPSAQPIGPGVEIQIASVANLMLFDKTKLSVPAGARVHLVFKNTATVDTLPHNWLLVNVGTEARVAAAGLVDGPDAGYVPPSPDVPVATPLAAPRQTVDVTFTAPAPGAYPYICTVPGHYMMMKGVLTVTPAATPAVTEKP